MPSIASRKKRTMAYKMQQQQKRQAAMEATKKKQAKEEAAAIRPPPSPDLHKDEHPSDHPDPESPAYLNASSEEEIDVSEAPADASKIFRTVSKDSTVDQDPMAYAATSLQQLGSGSEHDSVVLSYNQQALTEDIYALMSTSKLFSGGFFFALSIFLIQMGILSLVLTDLVDMSDEPVQRNGVDNRLNLPADTPLQVSIAQCLGIILIINFAVAEGDLLRGITHLVDGFDPDLLQSAPHAKRVKWHFAGVCQCLVGAFMVMDAFILMMQSVTVIEMCLNFAALSFVQDFDDAAFAMGTMGLLSRKIQADCLKVGHLVVKSENRNKTRHVRRFTVLLLTVALFIPYWIITGWKWSGSFMCDSLYVQFGDAYGPEWPYYSGRFHAMGGKSITERSNGRVVYLEPTGTLQVGYCPSLPAWTVSNRTEVGDDFCSYMIRSEDTNTFDVVDVATDNWYAATTTVGDVPMDWMAVVCADCNEDLCDPSVGQCVNNQCQCHKGFVGLNCEFEVPECTFLGLDMRSKGALPSLPFASLFLRNEFVKLEDDLGLADQFYNHPIYASYDEVGNINTLILFSGRRWIIMGTPQETTADFFWDVFVDNLVANDVLNHPLENLLNTTRTFSSLTPFFFSGPVDFGTKTHQVDPIQTQWVLAVQDESLPLLGYRGDDTFDVTFQFICSHCNDTYAPCMNGGTCNATSTYCDCPESYDGYRCEYSLNCREKPCLNGGTCDEVFNICTDCDPLYYGNLCQFKRVIIDESGNIDFESQAALLGDDFFVCVNGTTCNNGGWCTSNVTACSCLPDFAGDRCEFLRDNSTLELQDGFLCANTTCINDGWCVGNSTECTCPEPFTGTFCEQVFGNSTFEDLFHCFNATCLNGGFCEAPTEPCQCADGYSGDYCESSANLIEGHELCSNSTCLNGGYCRNIVEVCYCPEGLEGNYCEIFAANGTSADVNGTLVDDTVANDTSANTSVARDRDVDVGNGGENPDVDIGNGGDNPDEPLSRFRQYMMP
ncbi:Notch ligand involved in the mediation of Notch signaling (By similarity) [Seminavis robusta]|uniref:Notch ligand involved in the mediation of Notch signaling By similarity n=1 Tax=Seminavis robusta TaxID=568900 RepID=A0A9N8HQE6_9STRA|nr:Notch ligand involved in the mediation of Notch signaling (By similarity) [Seminavis robusta]|eukprot:Sro978_g227090.1 Notch ligand involved in the mediation of Notch signaling (By similarity) (1004) ;mRNA; f:5650-9066